MTANQAALALRILVKPLAIDCRGCLHKGRGLCTWCASLCRDEQGQVYVSVRPFNDGDCQRWRWRQLSDLTAPPEALLVEA